MHKPKNKKNDERISLSVPFNLIGEHTINGTVIVVAAAAAVVLSYTSSMQQYIYKLRMHVVSCISIEASMIFNFHRELTLAHTVPSYKYVAVFALLWFELWLDESKSKKGETNRNIKIVQHFASELTDRI